MKMVWVAIPALLIGASAGAAEIATETTENGVKTRWSVMSIGPGNVLRIDEGGFGASATTSSGTAAGGSANETNIRGRTEDTMIYNPDTAEIMSVEGNICRVLSRDSAPPPGMDFMGGADMQAQQRQMAEAMKGANAQIAEAMRQAKESGASQAEIDAMNAMLGNIGRSSAFATDNSLHVVSLDRSETVGDYRTDVYVARTAADVDKYRLYMVDIDKVPGGRSVKDGIVGMVNTFADYMEGINAGALMNEGLTTVLTSAQFADSYPVAFEDLRLGTRTVIVNASAAASSADFAPACEKRDMMAN